jgi:RNA polymerase sigma-70 factor (ECF subfamily)
VTDADLVAHARQGDAAAFGELVDRHRTAVYRAALAALGSHAEAEDAAQDAFVLAFRRLDGFRGEASFKTWVLAIAWRQAINRRRSLARIWRRVTERRERREEVHEEMVAAVAAIGPTPEEAAMHADFQRAVAREIRLLSPTLRDTLLLAQSGTYTYDEIAGMLRTPTGTIKWRVAEARRVIKQRLRQRGYDDVGRGR